MKTAAERDAIRARLAELENEGGGRLTPAAVVEDAKNPDSPLHGCFEWDVDKAAEAHWLNQARDLITSIRVVTKTEHTSVKSVFYVRDPSAATGEQGFVSLGTLQSDEEMAREALLAEFARIADLLRRARALAVAVGASDDVERMLESVVGMRARLSQPSAMQ